MVYSLEGVKASPSNLLIYFVDPFLSRPVSFYPSDYIVFHPAVYQRTSMSLLEYLKAFKSGASPEHRIGKACRSDWQEISHRPSHSVKPNQVFFANEMIADNAAMRLVYDSFMNLPDQEVLPGIFGFYSAKQAFFITAAQEYCSRSTPIDFMENLYINNQLPSPIKIQNIISNCLEFTDAFACEPGSGMSLLDSSMITQFPYIPYNDEDYSYKFFMYS
ncbi:hypothetical protein NQ317_019191 [Molorchus minor]|uniref:Peptidase M13 C-terminal domain-containing protein n=1 Tax=Molorchus minor TaxID=1323400 RepID=A0ABQ9J5M4_9CUCU|nr:hypothetical protein NQ317_019191 [Molorchus minor]